MKPHAHPSIDLIMQPLMPEILKKTAGLIYSIRYVVPAVALTIYVIAGLAYFVAFKYWPSLDSAKPVYGGERHVLTRSIDGERRRHVAISSC